MDGHDTHVAVRMVHVLASTVMLGGSFGLATAGWGASVGRAQGFVTNAVRYEIAFWVAFGVIVATGVGNLGVFGSALPGPETDWGRTLSIKLVLVFVLALVSASRAVVVVRLRDHGVSDGAVPLGRFYPTTAALTGVIVCFAVWLAHG